MRLTEQQQTAIKHTAKEFFGDGARVYLFGSRTDDTRRGGDIDLCIFPKDRQNLLQKKVKFLASLDRIIGEQKIDVILYRDGKTGIEQTAMETGVPL
ncbi:nucleotidyltransferase domain-containing protein [Desulfonatronum thioautotrophicum]|uniref:nucleotidyltransferase domain-containing protein n=1 Tax=Desulfonatronum thioautotrophicum TaxID=617001 RepID=UPI000A0196B8|nr:nucleotidyltransferase domain-containing protein [Desulfonatronum thioautotrophicum]